MMDFMIFGVFGLVCLYAGAFFAMPLLSGFFYIYDRTEVGAMKLWDKVRRK